ncbi:MULTISPECIES: outer membrane protein assembly factor BamA [unclassified Iodidimonas]|uniref:outer membrane protein assembly factor BamA n=1 Tax=unclassified Iodidimonas TaxID=2626145 RepID=UPI0024821801|nr:MULTISPECIES: outer membrane protein assembly factor BamA [unclassified Iodidimonas]
MTLRTFLLNRVPSLAPVLFRALLASVLLLWSTPQLKAQDLSATPSPFAVGEGRIEGIAVRGIQRIESATVVSYLSVRIGDPFDPRLLDDSLKSLFATGLFADVSFDRRGNTLIIDVAENPIINRIIFDGNKRLDNEELSAEVQLRPRIVFTRAKVQADVQRMLDLYRRSGRFAAVIEPKVVQLPQNRVDLIFEISEGPKSKIRRINIIGNSAFSDKELRSEMATSEARWWRLFGSNDTYDPDRQAFDREQLRQFYFNNGYADFRVVSATAELTPNREDFIVTFVIEEGETYRFGKVEIESEIRDIDESLFRAFLGMQEGQLYNLDRITGTVERLTNAAGILGFAFVTVRPIPRKNRETNTLDITFRILDAPRVYVERINVHGNVRTRDQVVRREFRLVEGDAFNLSKMERSRQRINSLGFFRGAEVEQLPGSRPDRLVLDVSLEEDATGELSLGAAFSSLENFIFEFSIRERNLLGRAQELRLNFSLSSLRQQIDLGFTEPRFLGRNISAGIDLFRINLEQSRFSSFRTTTTGISFRLGLPIAERAVLALRYSVRRDLVDIGNIDPNRTSRFIRDQLGDNITSLVGYSLIYDSLNHPLRPTRGQRAVFSQDLAGVGGDIFYLRSRLDYDKFVPLIWGFYGRLGAEGGYIRGLGQDIRINDRFFLGGPRVRGFDTAGLGPAAVLLDNDGNPITGFRPDFIGGEAFYQGTAELFLPLGEAARELGVQASLYLDAASLFEISGNTEFEGEAVFGDTAKPRISVGVGVAWESPFGPFRIDFAKILQSEEFDDTKTFQFNVGTSF